MKATYRAKYNAMKAKRIGIDEITITRSKGSFTVYIDDILKTEIGKTVPEETMRKYYRESFLILTYKELMSLPEFN